MQNTPVLVAGIETSPLGTVDLGRICDWFISMMVESEKGLLVNVSYDRWVVCGKARSVSN